MTTALQSTIDFIETELQDGRLTIAFNRPDAMNALRPEMLAEAARLVSAGSADQSVSVIVLTGRGRAFSAGVDLKVLQGIQPEDGVVGNLFDEPAAALAAAIRDAGVPVIARVVGACFTGALEIGLHCDFMYTTASTKFGDTHVKFGLRPTWGMSQTLSRALGQRRARELSFTAKTFSGHDAKDWGLANEVFDEAADLDVALDDTCRRIVGNSSDAVAAVKDLYRQSEREVGIEESLKIEGANQYTISDTAERLSTF